MPTSPNDAKTSLSPPTGVNVEKEYAFASLRNMVFDAVIGLLAHRRERDQLTQTDLAKRIDWDPALLSRTLAGPKNWTLKTWSDLVYGLDGHVEIRIPPRETAPPTGNYDIYSDLFGIVSSPGEVGALATNTIIVQNSPLFGIGTAPAASLRVHK
jgi:hypothetical protein